MSDTTADATPVYLIPENAFENWIAEAPAHVRAWAAACAYKGGAGRHLAVPGENGELGCVLALSLIHISEPTRPY